MTNALEKLLVYFEYPFVRYAFIVGVLIALCSSLFGTILVLKRFSFIGDGLSHFVFGVMAIATVLNLSGNMLFVLPITIICAILLLRGGQNAKIKGDAAMALISVGSLAIGYLIMNVFSRSVNLAGDVCNTLFGSVSILTLSSFDVTLCALLSTVIIICFMLFYNKIFSITFDEEFARASGIKVGFYNTLVAIFVAVIIVLAMNLVGSLLISALVIFPTVSAMRLFKSFKSVTLASAVIAVFAAIVGILVSILFATPMGATIVVINLGVFFCFCIIGKFVS